MALSIAGLGLTTGLEVLRKSLTIGLEVLRKSLTTGLEVLRKIVCIVGRRLKFKALAAFLE